MKRGRKSYAPRCVECHEPIPADSDHYRLTNDVVLERVCGKHSHGTRQGLLDAIGRRDAD